MLNKHNVDVVVQKAMAYDCTQIREMSRKRKFQFNSMETLNIHFLCGWFRKK